MASCLAMYNNVISYIFRGYIKGYCSLTIVYQYSKPLNLFLQLAVVITDGKQTKNARYTRLSAASRGIKDKGVTVYAVGVGSGVDKEELREIASESQNVLTSSSFKDLQNISLGLTKRLCAGKMF